MKKKISKKQSEQTKIDVVISGKYIDNKERLVHVVERYINSFNNIKGKQFIKNGYGEVFQRKVEDISARFGLNQVKTGLEKGKVKLRQYTTEQLVKMYEALQNHSLGTTGTVKKYEQNLMKNHALIQTIQETIGEDAWERLPSKGQYVHSFLERMKTVYSEGDYDSDQVLTELEHEFNQHHYDELAREVYNRERKARDFLERHNVNKGGRRGKGRK